jgi:hypothetical protein
MIGRRPRQHFDSARVAFKRAGHAGFDMPFSYGLLFAYAQRAAARDALQPMKPSPVKPASIIEQVESSGTPVPTY